MGAVIGRLHHLIVDCPDPAALAGFYSELLGLPITWQDEDFVVVSTSGTTSGLAFQRAANHQPPQWPDPARPQQLHLDVMVDDGAVAQPLVIALGASPLSVRDGYGIYADRAGHPFCLIHRPGWAPPVAASAAPLH